MTDPEWGDLKILLALVRGGSVAGAARCLNVDHSTVSRRLAALEEAAGATLIVRGGREFAWTAAGRTLLAAAEAMESSVVEALRGVRSAQQGVEGSVRVSLPPGIMPVLARLLPAACAKYPQLSIELCGENRSADLAKGEADIALRMFRPTERGLVSRQAFEVGWVACASAAYVAEFGVPRSVAELQQHRLVRYAESMRRAAGPRWLEAHSGTSPAAVQVDNTDVAAHTIARGVGIGVVPSFVAGGHSALVRVFAEPVAFGTGFIVYHESARETARLRAAVDTLAELFEEHATLFSGRSAAAPSR